MKNINQLYGAAWEAAIRNVISILNIAGAKYGVIFTYRDSATFVQELASELNIKFDENGNIIKSCKLFRK